MEGDDRGGDIKGGENKKIDLAFVNMNVASAAEKERNQKIVRSTAMKSFRRRQQSERESGKWKRRAVERTTIDVGTERITKLKEPLIFGAVLFPGIRGGKSRVSGNSPSPESESSSSDSNIGEGSRGVQHGQIDVSNDERLQFLAASGSSPPSMLGAGRVDPFAEYYVEINNTAHVPELIDHFTIVWRGLRPAGDNRTTCRLAKAWLDRTKTRPVVMHAMLFGAQVHLDVLRAPRVSINNPVRLYHKVQTMRLLKEELKQPEKFSMDDLLLVILTLSANEIETVENNMMEKERSPFNSPLAGTQWLDVYGSMTHHAAHSTAMKSLMVHRGGLEKIELEGLAEVLSFADILEATQRLKKPDWPLLKRTLILKNMNVPEVLRVPLQSLGRGFHTLLSLGVDEHFLGIIGLLVDLTITIDCHHRGVKQITDQTKFIDRRNSIQHQLLSLPFGSDLKEGELGSRSVYECVRLATLIYSVGVTFPLPTMTGVFRRLASRLMIELEASRHDPAWVSTSQSLLWVLVLGGIAAQGTEHRSWYVQNLLLVSSAMKVLTWRQMLDEVKTFLWLDSACENGGRELWSEMKLLEN